MKTIPSGLATHLQQRVTSLCVLWHLICVDGEEFFFTDHDADVLFESNLYLAAHGFNRSATTSDDTYAVGNLDISGILSSSMVSRQEVQAGKFDYAAAYAYVVNWRDPSDGGGKLRRGSLGEVTMTPSGLFRVEFRGLTQALQQTTGEVTSKDCRNDLGDGFCKTPIAPPLRTNATVYAVGAHIRVVTDGVAVGQAQYENRIYRCTTAGTTDIAQPTYDETVGNPTTDGTAVFTAVQAWTRHAVVATVTDRRHFTITVDEARAVDNWFNGGVLTFETGDNTGRSVEVLDWTQGTSAIELEFNPSYLPEVGDKLRLYPGCGFRIKEDCRDKFDNVLNFKGEASLPGEDLRTRFPDAK